MGLPPVPTDHMPMKAPSSTPYESVSIQHLGVPYGFDQFVSAKPDHDWPTWTTLQWNGRFIEHISGRVRPDVTVRDVTLGSPGVRVVKGHDGKEHLDFSEWAHMRWHLRYVRVDDLIHPDGTRVGVPPPEVFTTAALIDWCEDRLCHPEVMKQVVDRQWYFKQYWSTEPSERFSNLKHHPRYKAELIDAAIDRIRETKTRWREVMQRAADPGIRVPRLKDAPPEPTPAEQMESWLASLPEDVRRETLARLAAMVADPAPSPVEGRPVVEPAAKTLTPEPAAKAQPTPPSDEATPETPPAAPPAEAPPKKTKGRKGGKE